MSDMKWTLKTEILDKYRVQQELLVDKERIITWMLNTQEGGVRNALITMGWSPPGGPKNNNWRELFLSAMNDSLTQNECDRYFNEAMDERRKDMEG